MRNKSLFKKISLCLVLVICVFLSNTTGARAAEARFSVSPMNQKIVLTAGETYYGSFKVTNPDVSDAIFEYELGIKPFTVSDEYNPVFENNGDYNQIVDWITLDHRTGSIVPNNTHEIRFRIDVPEDAPAGGQYAAIMVTSANDDAVEGAVNIQAKYEIAHIIYAEVSGETVRQGNITNITAPSFLLNSSSFFASAIVENVGNVHGDAKYSLQIFPLFSDEEIYTTEEDPQTRIILPGSKRFNATYWPDAPAFGLFHVVYNVEFEGTKSTLDKFVFICPLWIAITFFIIVFLIIFWLIARSRSRRRQSSKFSD